MCKKLVCLVSVVLVVGLAGSALAAHPNLVAWWPFDSDYDNAQGDSSLDGSANGGGVSITTTGGEYIRGDGGLKIDDDTTSTNYVDVRNEVIQNNQQVFTIVTWYKYSDISSDGSDERGFIWETTPGYSSGFAVRSANSDGTGARDAEWFFDPDPTLPSGFSEYHRDDDGPIISDGSWHHLAMVWNQTNDYIKYYHDGAMTPVFSLAGDTRNLVDSSGLHIGNHRAGDGARGYDGFIDDMAVYDVELSAACVKALYDGSFGGQNVDPNNVLYVVEELKAWSPSLSYGIIGVDRNADLSWSAGEYAADTDGHDVYFGTNESDVSAGTGGTSKGRQTGTTYEPGTLSLDTMYYWVIDEVNDSHGDSPWLGDVLNFDVKNCTADMKKGPYVIYEGTNTEMTVLWQLSSTQSCNIAWGLDTSYSTGNSNTSEYGGDHQHKYSITSLTPGTKYYYKVTVGSDYSIGSFRAAPASDATSVTFYAYGDTRNAPANQGLMLQGLMDIYEADPNLQTMVLFNGDFVEFGQQEQPWTYQFFSDKRPDIREFMAEMPFNASVGNHEFKPYSQGGWEAPDLFMKYWPYPWQAKCYWSFDYGPAHIVIADQYAEGIYPGSHILGSTQLTWIENDLAATDKQWKIIMFHEPAYGANSDHEHSNTRTYIQPLCETYDVALVLAGHAHFYARCEMNGVKHITAGGGGAPYSTGASDYADYVEKYVQVTHFCKIAIDGNELNFEAINANGTVIDSFTIDRTPDTTAPTPDPMEWSTVPYATGCDSIAMVAATASDPAGVEYYFTCTAGGGNDSDWQDEDPSYEDSGLQAGSGYTYTVKARDKSPAQNETGVSSAESATTDALTTMHVESVVCEEVKGSGGNKYGRATVTIYNNCGAPVVSAYVDGTFSGDFEETIYDVTTNGDGEAVFTTTAQVKKPAFTFTVDDVTHGTLTYDANDNLESDCTG